MWYAFIIIAAYFGLLVILAILARPHRERVVHLTNELISDYPNDDEVKAICEHARLSALSWRAAPIRLVTLVLLLLISGNTLDKEFSEANSRNPKLLDDPRIAQLFKSENASLIAVNPVFGALMMIAVYAFKLKAFIHHRGGVNRRQATFMKLKASA